MIQPDVKLAIRADRGQGVIWAYVSSMDDADRTPFGSLAIAVADRCPGAFDAWVKGMEEVFRIVVTAATGAEVVSMTRFTAGDKN